MQINKRPTDTSVIYFSEPDLKSVPVDTADPLGRQVFDLLFLVAVGAAHSGQAGIALQTGNLAFSPLSRGMAGKCGADY